MRKLTIASIITIAAIAIGNNSVSSSEATRTIRAWAPESCVWDTVSQDQSGDFILTDFANGNTIDGNTYTVPIGTVRCNTNAWVKIRSDKGGLTSNSTQCSTSLITSGTSSCVLYDATVRWGAVSWSGAFPNITGNGTPQWSNPVQTTDVTPQGALSVELTTKAQTETIQSGYFTDIIKISVGTTM